MIEILTTLEDNNNNDDEVEYMEQQVETLQQELEQSGFGIRLGYLPNVDFVAIGNTMNNSFGNQRINTCHRGLGV